MNALNIHRKSGASLVIVMISIIIIALIGLGLAQLTSLHGTQTVRFNQSAQSFWIAEGGLNHIINLLMKDSNFRDDVFNNTIVSETADPFLDGSDTITFSNVQQVDPIDNPLLYEVTINSRGTYRGISREIQVTIETGPGFDSAIWLVGGGATELHAASTEIDGKIYIPNGTMDFGPNGVVPDGAFTTPPADYSGNIKEGFIEEKDISEFLFPPAVQEAIDFYSGLYASNFVSGTTNFNSNISGYTSYDDDLTLDGGINITGSGTILISGDLTIGDANIGDDISFIVKGDIQTAQNEVLELGQNNAFYSESNITFGKHTQTGAGILLVAQNDIVIDSGNNAAAFKGIIYAGGNVTIASNFEIYGTIVSEGNVNLSSAVTVTYDPSVFTTPMPNWLSGTLDTYAVISKSWREVPTTP